jgi:hypothetical protein
MGVISRRTMIVLLAVLVTASMLTLAAPRGSGGSAAYAAGPSWSVDWTYDATGRFKNASPTLGDVDDDGQQETVIGDYNGRVYCLSSAGVLKWSFQTGGVINGAPCLVDCDGNGTLEIFVGSEDGYVYGLNSTGGQLTAWGWPRYAEAAFGNFGVYSSPAAGDLDGDDNVEIVVGSWGHYICAWHYEGGSVAGWPYYNADTVWSSPACGDVDLDGKDEVLIGADCTGGGDWPWPAGGLVYCFEGDGQIKANWPKSVPQVVWSSPAIGDLNLDGFPDVVVGTGIYYTGVDGNHVYAWDGAGNSLPGWPVNTGDNVFASPALGDVDDDGYLEVACGCENGQLYVWEHNGTLKWQRAAVGMSSPIMADIDADGLADVIKPDGMNIKVWNGAGTNFIDHHTDGGIFGTPAAGDIDGDGYVEVVVGTGILEDGAGQDARRVYCFEADAFTGYAMPWPMFRRTADHRACFPYIEPPDAWPEGEVLSRFYFAEGYTGPGFDEYVLVMNPNDTAIQAQLRYILTSGKSAVKLFTIPANSRFTTKINDTVPGQDVSVTVISNAPDVICERAMYFNYGGQWTGGHDVIGATQTSLNWYFAEGYTGPGFDEWICVQNPGSKEAEMFFHFMTQEAGEITRGPLYVGPNSRATFKANDVLGPNYQTSLAIEASEPVVAERSMYFLYGGAWSGGHCVMGATSLSDEFYFAEGTTRAGFDEWLTIQNPNGEQITVNATYQMGEGQGAAVEKEYKVPAGGRGTVFVSGETGTEKDVSVYLASEGGEMFLAERPMYFLYGGAWSGGHCVIGAGETSKVWLFAEGYTGPGFDEWLCLQNPGTQEATVEITYLTQELGPLAPKTVKIKAGSRYTLKVNEHAGPDLQLSTVVEQTAGDVGIVVERPMYFLYGGAWDGGHDTLGYVP